MAADIERLRSNHIWHSNGLRATISMIKGNLLTDHLQVDVIDLENYIINPPIVQVVTVTSTQYTIMVSLVNRFVFLWILDVIDWLLHILELEDSHWQNTWYKYMARTTAQRWVWSLLKLRFLFLVIFTTRSPWCSLIEILSVLPWRDESDNRLNWQLECHCRC